MPLGGSDFCLSKILSSKQSCRRCCPPVCAVVHHVHPRLNPRQPSVLQVGFFFQATIPQLFLVFLFGPEMRLRALKMSVALTGPSTQFFFSNKGSDLMSPVVLHIHFIQSNLTPLLKEVLWMDLSYPDLSAPQSRL